MLRFKTGVVKQALIEPAMPQTCVLMSEITVGRPHRYAWHAWGNVRKSLLPMFAWLYFRSHCEESTTLYTASYSIGKRGKYCSILKNK
jgi:hypothetical protein